MEGRNWIPCGRPAVGSTGRLRTLTYLVAAKPKPRHPPEFFCETAHLASQEAARKEMRPYVPAATGIRRFTRLMVPENVNSGRSPDFNRPRKKIIEPPA